MSASTCLIISGLCFALVHSSVKFLPGIPAHEVVFFRSVISCILLLGVLRAAKMSPWGNNKKMLVFRGLAGTGALLLYFHTLQSMPLASAVTIQYLHPIFTVILAGIFLKESPSKVQWAFFATSFFGVLLVRGFDSRLDLIDVAIGIASALCSATAYNVIRALRNEDHPLVVVFYLPFVSLILTAPLTLANWVMPQGVQWLTLAVIGIFTQIAQYFMTLAYQADRAANISNLNYLGIVYAGLIGWFFYQESIEPLALIGMSVIVGSAIASSHLKTSG